MRLVSASDGRSHEGLAGVGVGDHHVPPNSVEILNTTQLIGPGATYNLDVVLPRAEYQLAHIQIIGARQISGDWREGADVYATRVDREAIGYSFRYANARQIYSATYSKQNSDVNLTHKIFDSDLARDNISLIDAFVFEGVLRLTFKNYYGLLQTLWVKGRALLW